jgi:hypothetical protein
MTEPGFATSDPRQLRLRRTMLAEGTGNVRGHQKMRTKPLLRSLVALAMLVLAACAAEDTQTNERGIDQDITATHDAGAATINNIGQRDFAPWRLNMHP